MEAAEAKVQRVLEGGRQFLVPHYQRPYSWREAQWKTLWADLVELVEDSDPKPHFMGSIVTSPARSVPEGIEKRLLIDGQQRLTTIMVLLSLIRDRARDTSASKLAEKVHDLITNRHEEGHDHFKLLPTQSDDPNDSDRDAFIRIVRGDAHQAAAATGIGGAYAFFSSKLRRDDAPDLEALFRTIVGKLTLVSIILDEKDNAHRIFESLNGKGRPLSQADLIRNYFFMRIDAREHEAVYRELWRPMQRRLGEELLASFVRHYLMSAGEAVRESDVYSSLKTRVDEDRSRTPTAHLKELVRFAGYYDSLVHPATIEDRRVRERMERLNRLEVTVAYPFLLSVMADFASGARPVDEVVEVLDTLENFLIRRFVCGVPTHGLNKIFPTLYGNSTKGTVFLTEMRRILASNARGYPRDAEFGDRLLTSRLYGSGDRREKTKFVLERLEAATGHKERVDASTLTIEHVMPQTLTEGWREHLGSSWEDDHEELLHTLGNLTLTSYNSELGNSPYAEKQARFAESHLELNRYFAQVPQWTATEIEKRAEALVAQAVSTWPYFGPQLAETSEQAPREQSDVTGSSPTVVRMRGAETVVRTWVDVAAATLEGIIAMGDEEFRRVVDDQPRFVNNDATALRRRARRLSNGSYFETNLSARAIHRHCVQAIQAAGVPAADWQVLYESDPSPSASSGGPSPRDVAYQAFFQQLIDELREKHQFTAARVGLPQCWYGFVSKAPGIRYCFSFVAGGRFRVELYIDLGEQAVNKDAFDKLLAERTEIESSFGSQLAWERLDSNQACRVAFYGAGAITDSPELVTQHGRWAIEHLLRLKAAFDTRVKALRAS